MQEKTITALCDALTRQQLPFVQGEPLASHTTFRIGGPAVFWCAPQDAEQLRETLRLCRENGVPYYPGCVTPTEIMQALELGITTVKFFPANIYGGLKALKALSAPFPQVRFIPTGGVDRGNIDEFLSFDKVAAIGGSFFVKEALEKRGEN